jgi:hypothetical protein
VVWEPFGGLCSASVAAVTLGRRAFAAETDPEFADLAAERLRRTAAAEITGAHGILGAAGILSPAGGSGPAGSISPADITLVAGEAGALARAAGAARR